MKYTKGDTLHIKVKVVDHSWEGRVVQVNYGSALHFYVDQSDVIKHEPKAITVGDIVKPDYGSVANQMKVIAISPDNAWAWLHTSYDDGTTGYATAEVDRLVRVE